MIYIFEGLDECGKTTLIKKIYKKHYPKFEYIHLKKPLSKKEILDFYKILQLYDKPDSKDLLLDRCYLISHYVYGSVFHEKLFLEKNLIFDMLFNLRYVKLFYASLNDDNEVSEQIKRIENAGDYKIADNFLFLHIQYEDFISELDYEMDVERINPFNYNDENIDDLFI